jgi:hypothetical protein
MSAMRMRSITRTIASTALLCTALDAPLQAQPTPPPPPTTPRAAAPIDMTGQ